MADEIRSDDIKNEMRSIQETAVKAMVYRYTIFNKHGAKDNADAKLKMGLLPFVGMVTALISVILLFIFNIIGDALIDPVAITAPFIIAVPIIVYRFRTVAGIANLSDRVFADVKRGDGLGPAGAVVPVLLILVLYGAYAMIGSRFMLFYVPALEIAVTLAVVSLLYFSKERKDIRYTDAVDTPGFITAIIISVIAGIVFACIPMAIYGALDIMSVVYIVIMFVIALLFGFIGAAVADKKFHGVSETEFYAGFEISRVFIAVLFLLIVVLIEFN